MQATCTHCGVTYTQGRRDQRYCSRKCAEASQPPCAGADCDRPRIAKGLCKVHYNATYVARIYYDIVCATCAKPHRTRRPDGKYCSETCAQKQRSDSVKLARSQVALWVRPDDWAEREFARRAVKPRPPRWFQSGQCRVCSTWFVSSYTHLTCSEACQERYERDARREHKHRRRARKRKAYVSAVNSRAIYERDGYRCHLCGKKLDMNAKTPAPLAPTIDHLLPLSKGGTHESANVKAAHFICNSLKGDRVEAVQGLLFG